MVRFSKISYFTGHLMLLFIVIGLWCGALLHSVIRPYILVITVRKNNLLMHNQRVTGPEISIIVDSIWFLYSIVFVLRMQKVQFPI